ncbi:MAG: electron transfer flavoprotein subunit alpha/FixB family protein [Acidimicrobiales bacterium]
MGTIFVVAEQRGGAPTSAALELCAAARAFAGTVVAFTWGEGSAEVVPVLAKHGVNKVFDLGDLGDSLAGPRVAAAIAAELAGTGGAPAGVADAVLAASSYDGRDVAARLSVRLDRPVLANVAGLRAEGGRLVSSHMAFGGAEVVSARFTGEPPGIFVMRPKAFPAAEVGPDGPGQPEVARVELPEVGATDAAKVVARHVEERHGPSLDDAKVVVSGGRGLGAAEHYSLIEELASLLGGAPGASRAIVDAGWVPYAYQVGQTGRTVKPEVYLAFGISGATQHLVGMKGATHVIAVDRDPDAPMLQAADLGVVGDVHEVLPKLIEVVKAKQP